MGIDSFFFLNFFIVINHTPIQELIVINMAHFKSDEGIQNMCIPHK